MDKVAALILTAGASRRMGEPKALLPWGGTTVVEQLIKEIEAAGIQESLLVTGAHHTEIESIITPGVVPICYHPDWERGMGSSIAKGVMEVENRFPHAGAVLILLVDQPLLTKAYIRSILQAHDSNRNCIIASDYGKFAGVPALFPKSFWSELKGIPPGQGAKGLIAKFPRQCRTLNPGRAIMDIDTPEAYRKALEIGRNQTK